MIYMRSLEIMAARQDTTLAVINAAMNQFRREYDVEVDTILKEAQENQRRVEREALKINRCYSVDDAIFNTLGSLNTREVSRLVQEQYSNHNVMQATSCLVGSILNPRDGELSTAERKRYYFIPKRRIGEKSVFGIALETSLLDIEGLFVLKAPRDPNDVTLSHEAVVGLFSINRLREYVPNFAYTLGAFGCTAPIVNNRTAKVEGWCSSDQAKDSPVLYIALENIKSISFTEFLKTGSADDFVKYLVQILYALNVAYTRINFTHYDLHPGNILLRKLPRVTQIRYGSNAYINTEYIPTIIDFGFSHVVENGMDLGHFGQEIYGVNYNAAYPMFDVYKLLLMCGEQARLAGNTAILNVVANLYTFFNKKDNINTALTEQRPLYYSLPRLPYYVNVTYGQFLGQIDVRVNYMRQPWFSKVPGPNLLQCNLQACQSVGSSLREFGLGTIAPDVDSIVSYIDIRTKLERDGRTDLIQQLDSSDNLFNLFRTTLDETLDQSSKLVIDAQAFKPRRLPRNVNELLKTSEVEAHQNNVDEFSRLNFRFKDIDITGHSLRRFVQIFGEDRLSEYIPKLNRIVDNITILTNTLTPQIVEYLEDSRMVRSLYSRFLSAIFRAPRDERSYRRGQMSWYTKDFPKTLRDINPSFI